MKREREIESITMANCLMLLSRHSSDFNSSSSSSSFSSSSSSPRVFECKTCNRQFQSFQALGGHRASHKKPRIAGSNVGNGISDGSPLKPKTHECNICGLEFAIGQALGGHMRRHRPTTTTTTTPISIHSPVVKKTKMMNGGGERILCLDLDLNLTPSENDSKFLQLGNNHTVSMVDCFF